MLQISWLVLTRPFLPLSIDGAAYSCIALRALVWAARIVEQPIGTDRSYLLCSAQISAIPETDVNDISLPLIHPRKSPSKASSLELTLLNQPDATLSTIRLRNKGLREALNRPRKFDAVPREALQFLASGPSQLSVNRD